MSRTLRNSGVPKTPIKKYNEFLSPDQHSAKKEMEKATVTVLTGKAGSGKTHLCTVFAGEQLALGRKRGGVTKIYITRPIAYDKTQDLGFNKGSIDEKFDMWVKPITEILTDVEGGKAAEELLKDTVDIIPLQYVQGRTFSNAIVIVDESQNCTKEQIKAIFTRLGKNSKLIFNGDSAQCLLEKKGSSGFPRLLEMADLVDGVIHVNLTTNHRNEIVERLLEKYD